MTRGLLRMTEGALRMTRGLLRMTEGALRMTRGLLRMTRGERLGWQSCHSERSEAK